jgi:hypothetical protein
MDMPQIDIPQSVLSWVGSGERGTSSETIVAALWGLPLTGRWGWSHPHDPADLRRCLLLLRDSPETFARFQEMRQVSPEWRSLVDRWNELERLFFEEAGEHGLTGTWWSAPKTYAAMRATIEGAFREAGSK